MSIEPDPPQSGTSFLSFPSSAAHGLSLTPRHTRLQLCNDCGLFERTHSRPRPLVETGSAGLSEEAHVQASVLL